MGSFKLRIEGYNEKLKNKIIEGNNSNANDEIIAIPFELLGDNIESEIEGFDIIYDLKNSENASGTVDNKIVKIYGNIDRVLKKDVKLMHLLRRWSKHKYGGDEPYSLYDEFYKKVIVEFIHNEKPVRKIELSHASLYSYEEEIKTSGVNSKFILAVRQIANEPSNINIDGKILEYTKPTENQNANGANGNNGNAATKPTDPNKYNNLHFSPEDHGGITSLTKNLKLNDNGVLIREMQSRLKELENPELIITGEFDEATVAAVNAFKGRYALGNDENNKDEYGIVGSQTWEYLFSGINYDISENTASYSNEIRIAKIRLKQLGYPIDNETGTYDSKMTSVINEFKKQNGVYNIDPYEGILGNDTWQVLFSGKANEYVKEFNVTEGPVDTYVTAEQLKQLGWSNITDEIVKALNNTLVKYDITTPERIRHFISQAMHESGLGIYTKELASGNAYEGRTDLGNTQTGDGPKYKGGGYIQMTGRANYQAFADYMGDEDIMKGVDYVSKKYPWEAAGFWWHDNGMNAIVDSLAGTSIDQQTLEISRAVNRGNRYSKGMPNHYEERRDYYILTLDIIK